MEIIEGDRRSTDGFVQIAYVDTSQEAALIRGLLRREGDIPSLGRRAGVSGGRGIETFGRSPRHIYVRPEDADEARELLREILVEEPVEDEIPEPVNATYLDEAASRMPRDHGTFGSLTPAYLVSAIVIAAVVVLLLLH